MSPPARFPPFSTHEIGILHCKGDFGGRKGTLNLDWWLASSTQYGELKTFEITIAGE